MPELRSIPTGAREQRFIPATNVGVAVRAEGEDGSVIEGHGALFHDETVIYGFFRERILPGAFAASIREDDIRVAFNHSSNFILGRTSAKTAEISEDDKGLRYKATPPETSWAKDVVTSIKRRDITGSSFQFEIENPDDEEWDYSQTKQGKLPLRTIKKARLYEVGPVAWPAYENTTVSARAIGKVEEARAAAEAEANDTCSACHGSGLNPERQMSDPKGQVPCDTCKGSGTRTAETPATVPVEVLERELELLDLEG